MKKAKKISSPLKHGCLIFLLSFIGQSTLQGYIHPADPFVLLAAMRLPTKQAILACGIASALADILKGYYYTAPFTFIIKVLMVLAVRYLMNRPAAQKHSELWVSAAALIPVPGYFIAQLIKWQVYSWVTDHAYNPLYWAVASLQKNLIQAVASILIFLLLYDLIKGFRKTKALMKAEQEKELKEEQSE